MFFVKMLHNLCGKTGTKKVPLRETFFLHMSIFFLQTHYTGQTYGCMCLPEVFFIYL